MQEKGQILGNEKDAPVCSGKSDMKISGAHAGIARKSWELGKNLKIGLGCMEMEKVCGAKRL